MNKTKVISFIKSNTMILMLILVTLFFVWQTGGKILFPQNISNLIAQNAYVFILATGMLLCILTGGNIDLAVGSIVCFVGAVGAKLMETYDVNWIIAVAFMLVMGIAIGAWQGFWIAYVRVPPFITTLAGMFIFRGLSNVVLQGLTVSLTDKAFIRTFGGGANCYIPDFLGGDGFNVTAMLAGILTCIIFLAVKIKGRIEKAKKGYEMESIVAMITRSAVISAVVLVFSYELALYRGIPTALVIVAIVVLAYAYITAKTTLGRHFYAVGGNEKAAKLSGIDTNRIYFFAYTNMGFLSALAGMMTIARMTSAQPTYGQNYEMDAISSCFIGGASAYGGTGKVSGVIIGAVFMGVINLGMSIMGVDANYQKVVKGGVLLAAVIFDVVSKKKNG
ncbi:putative multiple sugar transport system permease protein [Ruminiclostridium sufflavum DSM 19573]|uniref:Xylose transport system permease protein XylH n=1 Tax=Ruminiclostridium sufflavum DSM 19573 TaxID=1121337 RepID=A0A318XP83_9FIRM|nr:multiple monosaccharide ABC transporter permease [Ruminiclostridium sufflavum]PYG87438.1 putative multiple sugar transport system permease protein [Ruminiclostridium sufflavum DSM 19573]